MQTDDVKINNPRTLENLKWDANTNSQRT
jgi:hypothetical protein